MMQATLSAAPQRVAAEPYADVAPAVNRGTSTPLEDPTSEPYSLAGVRLEAIFTTCV